MKNDTSVDIPRLVKRLAAQRNVEEINEFLQLSQKIFGEKLSIIEEEMEKATTQEERDLLKHKALQLYKEYKHSLSLMETYLNEIDLSTSV